MVRATRFRCHHLKCVDWAAGCTRVVAERTFESIEFRLLQDAPSNSRAPGREAEDASSALGLIITHHESRCVASQTRSAQPWTCEDLTDFGCRSGVSAARLSAVGLQKKQLLLELERRCVRHHWTACGHEYGMIWDRLSC